MSDALETTIDQIDMAADSPESVRQLVQQARAQLLAVRSEHAATTARLIDAESAARKQQPGSPVAQTPEQAFTPRVG